LPWSAECERLALDSLPRPVGPMFKWIRNRRATLAECPKCGADFVHPVEWRPHDDDSWWMLLRCGACGASREAIEPNAQADMFDLELDRMQADIRAEADRLERERQAEEAERFAAALDRGLINPDDFER
jgi:transcription elongation factor Elf1